MTKLYLSFCRCFLLWSSLFVILIADAEAANWEILPGITLSEEFTDNVYETRSSKRADLITRVLPGIKVQYDASFGTLDAEYRYDYRYYLRQSIKDDDTHKAKASGHFSPLNNILFLDAADHYQRISLDVSRDLTKESLFLGQTDENTVIASPYVKLPLSSKSIASFGYRYTNYWYENPVAIDRVDHTGFLEAGYELARKTTVKAGYSYTHTERPTGNSNLEDAYLGFEKKYGPDDGSVFSAKGGWTIINYKGNNSYEAPFWNVQLKHQFNYLVASVGTKVLYGQDPIRSITQEAGYSAALDFLLLKGLVGGFASYSRFWDTEHDQLITKRSSAGIRARYELLSQVMADVSLEVARYDNSKAGPSGVTIPGTGSEYYRTIQTGAGASYSYSQDLKFSLLYRFIDYHSPTNFENNRVINRVILEVRKVF